MKRAPKETTPVVAARRVGRPTSEEQRSRRSKVLEAVARRLPARVVAAISAELKVRGAVVLADVKAVATELGEPAPEAAAAPVDEALVEQIKGAKTIEQIDALLETLVEQVARGSLEGKTARVLRELLTERRQVLRDVVRERARVDASKPVTINVRFVDDWLERVKANEEKESEPA